jgi:hypothetical protein
VFAQRPFSAALELTLALGAPTAQHPVVDIDDLISRSEVTDMLFAFSDTMSRSGESSSFWRTTRMAETKRRRKTTPEERARWAENQRRLEELIEKRLERDGTTREEIRRELGWPDPSAR